MTSRISVRGGPGLQAQVLRGNRLYLQDLLRSVLQLHFDDVRAVEWNPSYGRVQSRSDLVLKQERIVIETKMTRKSLTQKELALQLIRDKEQYRGNPDCGTLVFFVYDSERCLSNSAAIEHDLPDVHDRHPAVVVISPRALHDHRDQDAGCDAGQAWPMAQPGSGLAVEPFCRHALIPHRHAGLLRAMLERIDQIDAEITRLTAVIEQLLVTLRISHFRRRANYRITGILEVPWPLWYGRLE